MPLAAEPCDIGLPYGGIVGTDARAQQEGLARARTACHAQGQDREAERPVHGLRHALRTTGIARIKYPRTS